MSNLDLVTDKVAGQIQSRVDLWESGVSSFLEKNDEYAKTFKLDPPDAKKNTSGFTRTRVAETTRATMALATSMYRMATANDPLFDLASLDGLPEELESMRLYKTSSLLLWQLMKLKYKRNLFKAFQGVSLFGTQVVEESWKSWPPGSATPLWEGLEFLPISLLQFAFDPNSTTMEQSDYHTKLDYITPSKLRRLSKFDPNTWDQHAVDEAIEQNKNQQGIPARVRERRERAGYTSGEPVLELMTQYGPCDDLEEFDGIEPVITLVNGTKAVRAHGNPFPGAQRPFRIGHYIEFELEPYGLGVGRLGHLSQRQLDGNRNRTSDLITASLLNQWLVARASGINPSQFRFKPNGVIEGDDISENSLRPLRPLIEAAQYGMQLDRMAKDELRGSTGAVPNLLAIAEDSPATNASIAQNEALKRVAVPAGILADEFIREHLMMMHKSNHQWLDREIMVAVMGQAPTRVSKRNMVMDAEFFVKVATDRDSQPNRVSTLQQLLAILTSIRNKLPIDDEAVVDLIREIYRSQGINPARVVLKAPPSIIDRLSASQSAAQGQAEGAPDITPAPSAMAPMEVSQDQIANLPAGLTELTP